MKRSFSRSLRQFIYNLFLLASQTLNTLLLGDPDESFSGRLGRAYISGRAKWFVYPLIYTNDLFWIVVFGEKDHSVNSIEPEERPYEKELWSWIKPN